MKDGAKRQSQTGDRVVSSQRRADWGGEEGGEGRTLVELGG